jgi:hypothetical protein
MLRPACLLPAARLLPPHGLLTPRSGREVSLLCLGPATRRTDAYRDGTFTRWSGAASQGWTSPCGDQSFLSVTTHHAKRLSPLQGPRCRVRCCVVRALQPCGDREGRIRSRVRHRRRRQDQDGTVRLAQVKEEARVFCVPGDTERDGQSRPGPDPEATGCTRLIVGRRRPRRRSTPPGFRRRRAPRSTRAWRPPRATCACGTRSGRPGTSRAAPAAARRRRRAARVTA